MVYWNALVRYECLGMTTIIKYQDWLYKTLTYKTKLLISKLLIRCLKLPTLWIFEINFNRFQADRLTQKASYGPHHIMSPSSSNLHELWWSEKTLESTVTLGSSGEERQSPYSNVFRRLYVFHCSVPIVTKNCCTIPHLSMGFLIRLTTDLIVESKPFICQMTFEVAQILRELPN